MSSLAPPRARGREFTASGLAGLADGSGSALRTSSWVVLVVAACAFTFALGAGLGFVGDPSHVAFAGVCGLLALAGAFAAPRWALVVAVFLLVAYIADAAPGVAGGVAASGIVVVLGVSAALRRAVDGTSLHVPRDAGWIAAYVACLAVTTFAGGGGSAATKQLGDVVGFTALVVLLLALLDSERWVRRFAWAIAAALGMLAVLAVYQQVSRSYNTDFGGLARVELDAGVMRSGGPLSANYFGQALAVGSVLALYLALAARSSRERIIAVVTLGVCVVALAYTLSRGAIVALIVAVLVAAFLRRVRLRFVVIAAISTALVVVFFLPPEVSDRVSNLDELVSPTSSTDPSLRGRASENLAAIEMWRAHPIEGVGPGNFERHYLDYSAKINIDPRAESRSAHSLYLESLAETGLIGSVPFFGVILLALWRPWQARKRLPGDASLLAEGAFVALLAFLVCALTLHATFPRYLWILVALALAAGRLTGSEAT